MSQSLSDKEKRLQKLHQRLFSEPVLQVPVHGIPQTKRYPCDQCKRTVLDICVEKEKTWCIACLANDRAKLLVENERITRENFELIRQINQIQNYLAVLKDKMKIKAPHGNVS